MRHTHTHRQHASLHFSLRHRSYERTRTLFGFCNNKFSSSIIKHSYAFASHLWITYVYHRCSSFIHVHHRCTSHMCITHVHNTCASHICIRHARHTCASLMCITYVHHTCASHICIVHVRTHLHLHKLSLHYISFFKNISSIVRIHVITYISYYNARFKKKIKNLKNSFYIFVIFIFGAYVYSARNCDRIVR